MKSFNKFKPVLNGISYVMGALAIVAILMWLTYTELIMYLFMGLIGTVVLVGIWYSFKEGYDNAKKKQVAKHK